MRNNDFTISAIVPAFNEEGNIQALYDRLSAVLSKFPSHEIIFIDDASTDNTADRVESLRDEDDRVKLIRFSRNFGHQSALRAGIDFASGDCVVMLDADLQHPPELIEEMTERWLTGDDIIYSVRKDDDTPFMKMITSRLFYSTMRILSDLNIEPGAADFRLIDRKVADIIKETADPSMFLRGFISWVGFRSSAIPYKPAKRHSGVSKYSYGKMMLFAAEGITSFSIKPLRLATILGFAASMLSATYGLYALTIFFISGTALPGWASTIISSVFLGGVQLLVLGIIGEYLGKLYMAAKGRPSYIIDKKEF